jgi:uncharacterized membrane protein YfcA
VAVGALVQGTAGFGFAIVVAPLLALIGPEMVPVPVLTAAAVLIVLTMLRERRDIKLGGAAWVLAGRVPGAFVGAFLLGVLDQRLLSFVIAGLVLVAVVTIASGASIPFNRVSQVAAGLASGITGTTTSIGGPPIALLYRERKGPEMRSTLAAIFTVGMFLNFAALGANGRVSADHLWVGFGLWPGTVVGFFGSSFLRRYVDGERLKWAVLVISTAAAVGLLWRTLAAR